MVIGNRVSVLVTLLLLAVTAPVVGGPLVPPGDVGLRMSLQSLDDAGLINIPLTTWPLAWVDINEALVNIDQSALKPEYLSAYQYIAKQAIGARGASSAGFRSRASAAVKPIAIRAFADTPRDEGELSAAFHWANDRFAVELAATAVANPGDGDRVRPDQSYIGLSLGNWVFTAGWQERWWGPGHEGSLILGSNARPVPALAVQRLSSQSFQTRWLRWLGPWSMSAFVGELDDERAIDGAQLLGMRATFRPLKDVEVGVSRAAQWCGSDRPCGASTLLDLLLGKDNRGVNVEAGDEPGNQLGGFDVRWHFSRKFRTAMYVQWIGEDSRKGGPLIGSWLRLAGLEHWGSIGALQHRSYVEVADTSCRVGGLGFSEVSHDCAYEHSIYKSGYRYKGRSLGHPLDGDSQSYSAGTSLLQSDGARWDLKIRYAQINRFGEAGDFHTVSAMPVYRTQVQALHERSTGAGRFLFGIGLSRESGDPLISSATDASAFLQWRSQ